MFGGQRIVASAMDRNGAIAVASRCWAVGDQIAFKHGLAIDGQNGKCGALGQIWAWKRT